MFRSDHSSIEGKEEQRGIVGVESVRMTDELVEKKEKHHMWPDVCVC